MIPAAHIHGAATWRARARAMRRSPVGRVVTWAVSLGMTQAALLWAIAGAHVHGARAFVGLGLVCTMIAAIVAATVWFVRFAIPVGGRRSIAWIVTAAFYGVAVATAPGSAGLVAATLLAPAIVWAMWLPPVSPFARDRDHAVPRDAFSVARAADR